MTSTSPSNPHATTIAAANPANWRWLAFAMLASGGLSVEAALATGPISTTHDWVAHLVAFVFVAMGAALAAFPYAAERHQIGVSAVIITTTTVQIAMLVAVARGMPTLPIFFLWPLLAAAYLYRLRGFLIASAFGATAYAVALLPVIHGGPFPTIQYLDTVFAAAMILAGVRKLSEIANGMFAKLKTIADFDPLTGLRNRRSFYVEAELPFQAAITDGSGLAVLAIDLDHFKSINDTFGHSACDEALRTTGRLLDDMFPAPHLTARIGGEEFVVVLPDTSIDRALELAVAFCDAIRASDALPDAVLTASVGVAVLRPGQTLDALLADADDAAYQAKNDGRNTVSINRGDTPGRVRLPAIKRSDMGMKPAA